MSLDEAGRRLIAQRNGVQLGRAQLSTEDQQLLAHMQTNRQARAVLLVTMQQLKRGYGIAADMVISNPLPGTPALARAMQSRLDNTARYAAKAYASIPDDTAPISALNRRRVEEVLRETRKSLVDISVDAEEMKHPIVGALKDVWDALIAEIQRILMGALPSWFRPDDPRKQKWITYAVVGTVALVGLFIAGKLIHTIVLGRSGLGTLGAAEAAAVALMDAQRRHRRAAHHGS